MSLLHKKKISKSQCNSLKKKNKKEELNLYTAPLPQGQRQRQGQGCVVCPHFFPPWSSWTMPHQIPVIYTKCCQHVLSGIHFFLSLLGVSKGTHYLGCKWSASIISYMDLFLSLHQPFCQVCAKVGRAVNTRFICGDPCLDCRHWTDSVTWQSKRQKTAPARRHCCQR